MILKEELLKRAQTLPKQPGCYFMLNDRDEVIYVGKAKDLRSRVSSYFRESSGQSVKTEFLVKHISDINFIVTGTEAEAFILENNLIKKHTPKYNIRLKDDKTYPYILVDYNEPFPRLKYVRKIKTGKKKKYFGPFTTGSRISEVIRYLTKAFQLRDCSVRELQSRKRPCVLYQIKQCSAPCVDYIDQENYEKELELAISFLSGRSERGIAVLEQRMHALAENEKFEQAAILRDAITELKTFSEFHLKQNVEWPKSEQNTDIISFHQGEEDLDLVIYMLRNGMLLGHKHFYFPLNYSIEDIEEEMVSSLFHYYSEGQMIFPDTIVLPFSKSSLEKFSEAAELKEMTGLKVKAVTKKYQPLFELASKYARVAQKTRLEREDNPYLGLEHLRKILNLKDSPRILECYDIAIWQGKSPTAAKIVFREGKADKTQYRHYTLEERPEGNNDFAMMQEVLERRLKKGQLPDVFVVDGGIQQVNVFLKVLEEKGIEVPIIGLAKARVLTEMSYSKEVNKSAERLVIPGRKNSIDLGKYPALFRILVSMRDEAHRFSRKLHHKHEEKRVLGSWLDEVPGIGKKTKQKILERMDLDRDELSSMSLESIERELRLSEREAQKLFEYFQRD